MDAGVSDEQASEGAPERAAAGAAQGRGVRPRPVGVVEAVRLLDRPDNTVSSIARLLGVSRSTIYKCLPELAAGVERGDIDRRLAELMAASRVGGSP